MNQVILNLLLENGTFSMINKTQFKEIYGKFIGNEITYSTEVLKYNLCDYNDAYLLVRGNITII